MNQYKVRGKIQLLESETEDDDGDEIFEYRYAVLEVLVELEPHQQDLAPEMALKTFRERQKGEPWEWREGYEPTVTLFREIPEAELMARIGAPRLFD